MRKLLLSLAMFFVLSGVSMAQFTNHPRYALINTLTQSLIEKVRIAQATYFAAIQAYFQGIITPSTPQSGDTDATPNWNVAPSDQPISWKDFDPSTFRTNFKIPFQITIDVYEAPSGWGWILRIDVYKSGLGPDEFGNNGNHWVYKHHEGPINPDAYGWILDKWYIEPDSEMP